jgi:hypothetical protein
LHAISDINGKKKRGKNKWAQIKQSRKMKEKKRDLDNKNWTEILIKREKRNKYQKEVERKAEERTQEAKTPFFWQSLNQSRNGLSVVFLLAPKDTAWKADRRSNQPKSKNTWNVYKTVYSKQMAVLEINSFQTKNCNPFFLFLILV